MNPNDRALAVQSISYQVEVSGEPFASGASEKAFTVPALGETDFDVSVTANTAAALIRYAMRGRPDSVDYRLFGKVHLASGFMRSIPFDEKGVFKMR